MLIKAVYINRFRLLFVIVIYLLFRLFVIKVYLLLRLLVILINLLFMLFIINIDWLFRLLVIVINLLFMLFVIVIGLLFRLFVIRLRSREGCDVYSRGLGLLRVNFVDAWIFFVVVYLSWTLLCFEESSERYCGTTDVSTQGSLRNLFHYLLYWRSFVCFEEFVVNGFGSLTHDWWKWG